MTERKFKVAGLGEIAIRCRDFEAMSDFYSNVIGLEFLSGNRSDGIRFFKIADGIAGHTTVLALFRHDLGAESSDARLIALPQSGQNSSLHHIALSLPFEAQDAVIAWYEKLGLVYRIEHFNWIGWRGIFTSDPDGNTVELVAKNPDWAGA